MLRLQIFMELSEIGIKFALSNCNATSRQMLEASNFYATVAKDHVYESTEDAVVRVKQQISELE